MRRRWPGSVAPEQEMMLIAAGTQERRQGSRERLQALAGEADWERLVALLQVTRLLPTLGPNLLDLAATPESGPFRSAVTAAVRAGARQDALLELVSSQVLTALGGTGIRAAVLKGPRMGEAIYGEAGRRLSGDVDVLVPRERLSEAVGVVRHIGYADPADHLWRDGLPLLHFTMVHRDGLLPPVELHWRIHWYETRFAAERLLPPEPAAAWRPRPADELAALLLYFARDGFAELRQAADLGAWWDRFGGQVPEGSLAAIAAAYPALGSPLAAAAAVAARSVGLPALPASVSGGRLGPRGRVAVRFAANPRPRSSRRQLLAEIGLVDGLLAPPGDLAAFLRRQVAPAPEVIREHAEKEGDTGVRSRSGYALRTIARFALAAGRLCRPWTGRQLAADQKS